MIKLHKNNKRGFVYYDYFSWNHFKLNLWLKEYLQTKKIIWQNWAVKHNSGWSDY